MPPAHRVYSRIDSHRPLWARPVCQSEIRLSIHGPATPKRKYERSSRETFKLSEGFKQQGKRELLGQRRHPAFRHAADDALETRGIQMRKLVQAMPEMRCQTLNLQTALNQTDWRGAVLPGAIHKDRTAPPFDATPSSRR